MTAMTFSFTSSNAMSGIQSSNFLYSKLVEFIFCSCKVPLCISLHRSQCHVIFKVATFLFMHSCINSSVFSLNTLCRIVSAQWFEESPLWAKWGVRTFPFLTITSKPHLWQVYFSPFIAFSICVNSPNELSAYGMSSFFIIVRMRVIYSTTST